MKYSVGQISYIARTDLKGREIDSACQHVGL